MKFTTIITTIFAATAMAAPRAISLERSSKTVANPTLEDPNGTVQMACIECPCDGWDGPCQCVRDGCCCKGGETPTDGWKVTV